MFAVPGCCSLLLIPTLWTAPALARAGEIAIVGAHLPGLDDAAAEALAAELERAVGELKGVEAVGLTAVGGRLRGREEMVLTSIFLDPGRARLQEGQILYERAEFEAAVAVLGEAVSALEDGLTGATDDRSLIEALLSLGLAQMAVGEDDKARQAFARVVVLEPQRRLDRVNYAPKVVEMFDEVRGRTLMSERGWIEVVGAGDAEIWIDGQLQEDNVSGELVPGRHYVLVQNDEGQRFFRTVELEAGTRAQVTAALSERLLAAPSLDTAERRERTELLYRSLGEHLDVDLVLLAGDLGDGRVGLQLYEPRTGTFSEPVARQRGESPAGTLTQGVQLLAPYLTDSGGLDAQWVSSQVLSLDINANPLLSEMLLDPRPAPVGEVGGGEVDPGPGARSWYLWAGASALAAGGAAGVAWWLLAGEPDPPTGTITVEVP